MSSLCKAEFRFTFFFVLLLCSYPEAASCQSAIIRGVYGNPASLLNNGYRFDSLGINAIFARSSSLSEELMREAGNQGVSVFVEFPTLNGKGYVENHPEAWPVDDQGQKAAPADWFMGVCPTDTGFMGFRTRQLLKILDSYKIDGIWLDYLHWHAQFETPEPILPETCFCDRCIRQFMAASDIGPDKEGLPITSRWILENKEKAWRDWRAKILAYWVEELARITRQRQPEAKVGIYYCPWYPDDYDSALYNIMGLDLYALAEKADVLSPMLYHRKMGRTPMWVKDYVEWLWETVTYKSSRQIAIWPIVQAHNDPGVISPDEFEKVLKYGMVPPSGGVMMFTVNSLISERSKLEIMKNLYREP